MASAAALAEPLTQATTAADLLNGIITAASYRLEQILEPLEGATKAKKIIVSGVALACTLQILADALGRDLEVSRELEASLRGAAVYVLEKLGAHDPRTYKNKTYRHDTPTAASYRERQSRQAATEQLFNSAIRQNERFFINRGQGP
jgi:gluconokinase